jgi:hypothetical protein
MVPGTRIELTAPRLAQGTLSCVFAVALCGRREIEPLFNFQQPLFKRSKSRIESGLIAFSLLYVLLYRFGQPIIRSDDPAFHIGKELLHTVFESLKPGIHFDLEVFKVASS